MNSITAPTATAHENAACKSLGTPGWCRARLFVRGCPSPELPSSAANGQASDSGRHEPPPLRFLHSLLRGPACSGRALRDGQQAGGSPVYESGLGRMPQIRNPTHRMPQLLLCLAGRSVMARRVAAASRELETSMLPLAQIAERTGFPSAAHFSTAFKKKTGLSPREYRAQRRGLRAAR